MSEILRESKWWMEGPTLTAFHGTSSALVPEIKKHGLKVPHGLDDLARVIIQKISPGTRISPKLANHIDQNILGSRRNDRGSVLYFHLTKDRAEGYAQSYAKHGGEIAYTLYRLLGTRERPVQFIHPEGKPVVLQVEIPREWVIAHQDLKELRERVRKLWMQRHPGEKSLEEFLESVSDFEIRCAHDLPATAITHIFHVEEDPHWFANSRRRSD